MTLLYYDKRLLDHLTGQHPERPQRLEAVARHLERTGLAELCQRPSWSAASLERVGLIHSPEYLAELSHFARRGGGRIEVDTVVSPDSYDVTLLAAGAICDAVERVVRGEDRHAFCLIRPPGHHALPGGAMGFCLLNHTAIAARLATVELGLERVLIVDWDVHHGNGTQDIFWTDPQVGYFSIHRWPFYPGTGDSDETGSGAGLGTTRNLPVEFGTSRKAYRELFRRELADFADKLKPQLVIISAGFDAHRDDPVGSLGLEIEDFAELTTAVQEVAEAHAGGRVVSALEGGYNPGILAGCIEVHLRQMLDRPVT